MRTFGEFIKQKRIDRKETLREFCRKYDFVPANHSRMERGITPPPRSRAKLERYAGALGIFPNSEDWTEFFDLAAIGCRMIPGDLMDDNKLLNRLPIMFQTIRDPEKLDEFIKMIRKS